MQKRHLRHGKSGQAMLVTVLLFMAGSTAFVLSTANPVISAVRALDRSLASTQSFVTAESAVVDAIYRIKKGHTVSSVQSTTLQNVPVTIEVSGTGGSRIIRASATSSNHVRKVEAEIFQGVGLDFFYGIQTDTGGFQLDSNAQVNGNVFTNGSIVGNSNSRINGDAYAVGTISSPNPVVTGGRDDNASVIPLPEIDWDYWKAEANRNNDPHTGDYNVNSNQTVVLGPKRINGNFNVGSGSTLTLTGPLYVTGSVNLNSNTDVYLDASFGSAGTVIVADGVININSGASLHPTVTTPKGYILLGSLSANSAVNLNSNSSSALIYAPNGTVNVNSNAKATAVIARRVQMNSNATIDYDLGLQDSRFASGPSGGWEIGSYQEVE